MLRMLYTLDVNPVPVESLRQSLELASRQAPDDDRVWLARGHLALIQGELDEADRWLSDCEARRPHDVAVCRMRLAWALAEGRRDVAWTWMSRMPADPNDPEAQAERRNVAA